jgi:hypothetical protein
MAVDDAEPLELDSCELSEIPKVREEYDLFEDDDDI